MENNARCPKCNGEFYVDFNGTVTECPNCGEKLETIKFRKYFSAFHDKAGARRDVHGQKYVKFDELLSVGAHHLEHEEFDKAKEAYEDASRMNPGDYRSYMGIVASETKNYTDLKNQTHKAYLQRAIAVATEEQKKHIADSYRVYDAKASMTDDELGEYLTEKQKDFKARIKRAIIGLSKVNESKKKRAKICFIFTWVLAGVALAMLTLGVIFGILLLMIGGLMCGLGVYATVYVWTKHKYNDRMYSFLVGVFNAMKSFNLSFEETDKMLGFMSTLLLSIKNGDPHSITDSTLEELVQFVKGTNSKEAKAFMKLQALTAKMMND